MVVVVVGVKEEEEEEQTWAEYFAELPAFDLYEALHLTQARFHPDRARAAYHRLSLRFHPHFGRKPDEALFYKLSLAYAALKDEERRRIYDNLGFDSLRKSEALMDPSVFEVDPFEFYDQFYAAVDPADKEYFLLNGLDRQNLYPSDSEQEDEGEDGDEQMAEEDDEESELNGLEEIHQPGLSEEEKAKLKQRAEEIAAKPLPAPPLAAMVSSMALPKPSGPFCGP
mmetsp:Transcript_6615/g.21361  ORF Transcript_6615/g.21361 Transcript_6615/m.21361 type:complete len:226 (+) Transcript_6615:1-678(+)